MRIVFFGTPEIAVPFFEVLVQAPDVDVAAVVCQPDKRGARGSALIAPPVKQAALAHGLPVLQYPTLRDESVLEALRTHAADAFVVFAYGKLIPADILSIPRLGCVNVHPSLLPHYRGPSPLQAPILNGDAVTGITIMKMDEGMDTGPLLAQQTIALEGDETIVDLTKDIMTQGPGFLLDTLRSYVAGTSVPVTQDETHATLTHLIEREDGRMDWTRSAVSLERMVRAYLGWPGTWTVWQRHGVPLRLKILEARVHATHLPSGHVSIQNDLLMIGCAEGSLEILMIQPEGKAAMTAAQFLRGYSDIGTAILA